MTNAGPKESEMPEQSEIRERSDMRDGKVDVGLDGFIRLQSAMKDFAEAEIARVAQVVKKSGTSKIGHGRRMTCPSHMLVRGQWRPHRDREKWSRPEEHNE